jgi:hypothetical protein
VSTPPAYSLASERAALERFAVAAVLRDRSSRCPSGSSPRSPRAARSRSASHAVDDHLGLKSLARKGVLDFNLHTKASTFYGEVRGQIYPATADTK